MDIIPVIDLLQGQVVHAKRGERHAYRPIQSSLCAGSEPLSIIAAIMQLYPFKRLYIADLDAIQQHGHHRDIIDRIRHAHPDLEIWLDAGISTAEQYRDWSGFGLRVVVGSENLCSMDAYCHLATPSVTEKLILSLDEGSNGFIGPAPLQSQTEKWPDTVIAMSLPFVGSMQGPDFDRIRKLCIQAPRHNVIAAGGVRHMDDIKQLESIGAKGVLIASALHDGRIKPQDLRQ